MNIQTEFEIGERAYAVVTKEIVTVVSPCPTCRGQAKVLLEGVEYACRMCGGEGGSTQTQYRQEVVEGPVWHMTITVSDRGVMTQALIRPDGAPPNTLHGSEVYKEKGAAECAAAEWNRREEKWEKKQ